MGLSEFTVSFISFKIFILPEADAYKERDCRKQPWEKCRDSNNEEQRGDIVYKDSDEHDPPALHQPERADYKSDRADFWKEDHKIRHSRESEPCPQPDKERDERHNAGVDSHKEACIIGIADDSGYEREGYCAEEKCRKQKEKSRELCEKRNGKTPEVNFSAEDDCRERGFPAAELFIACDRAEPVSRRIDKRSRGEVSQHSTAHSDDLLEFAFAGKKTAGSYISEVEDNAVECRFGKPEEKLRSKQRKTHHQRSQLPAPQDIFSIISKLPELHKIHLAGFFLYYEAPAAELFRKGIVLRLRKLFIGHDAEDLESLRIEPH